MSSAPSSPTRTTGIVLALAAPLWAALFLIPFQAAVERAPRMSVIAAMLLSAAIFNQLFAFATLGRDALRFNRAGLFVAGMLTVGTLLGNAGIALALPSIGPGMTSVVLKAQVLITPLLSLWVLSERASMHLWFGGLLALFGFAVPQLYHGNLGFESGYSWAMGAAWVFAAMQVITRRYIARIKVAPVNALRLWLAVATLLALPTQSGGGSLDLDAATWGLAATAGVLGPGISRLCLMSALRSVTASTTALLSLIGPIFAFLLGWIVFGDVPETPEYASAALILVGVLWPMLARRAR